jgi:hypothetical protein
MLDRPTLQFTQIPAYLDALKAANPATYTFLSTDPKTDRSQRVFICPPTSDTTFQNCRQFLAVDGTFIKSAFVQSLLLAVAIDGKNHTVPLAWALVESENKDSWSFFFIHLTQAI